MRSRGLTVIFETTFNSIIDVVFVDQVNACFTVLCSVYRGCSPLSCARGGDSEAVSRASALNRYLFGPFLAQH